MHRQCCRQVIQKRTYIYTKYGELVSKAPAVKSKEIIHPVLGKILSEFPAEPKETLLKEKFKSSLVNLEGRDLMVCLRDYHQRTRNDRYQLLPSSSSEDHLTLGQTVYIRRKLCLSKPQTQGFLGVVIEVNDKGPQSTVRVRNLVMDVGVELLIPIFSPLVERIKIIKKPKKVPVGPNLFGLRDKPDEIARFLDASLLSEKGRVALLKKLNST